MEHAGGRFVIVTNAAAADGSFAVAVAESREQLMAPAQWRTVVPADPARCVEDVDVMDAGLVLYERVRAAPCLRLLPLHGGVPGREVTVPAPAGLTVLRPGANADPASPHVRVNGSSPILPEATFDVDLQTGALRERRRLPVPGAWRAVVCVREREKERACMCVVVCDRGRECMCVCALVCVGE